MLQQHIYLCGYRGSGKSTVAKVLADRLAVPWIDTDDEIERVANRSIAEIFADEGESGFRDRESSAVNAVSELSPRVVALGGGAILRSANRDVIRRSGHVVWLDATAEVLASRIAMDQSTDARRPSLTGKDVLEEVREVLATRESIYRQVCDQRVDANSADVDTLVEQITQALGKE